MLHPKTKKLVDTDDNTSYKATVIACNDKYSVITPPLQYVADSKNGHIIPAVNLWKTECQKKMCTTKKKLLVENCCFSMTRRRCRSVSPSPPSARTDVPAKISQTTVRMQTLRPENMTRCKKLLRCNGYPNKVLLYAEESWARTAVSSYWTLSPTWWNCNRCKVVEVAGTKRYTAQAKMIETDCGNLYIVGSFKKCADPDFKLILTANITIADFNMGYCMTGSLERGSHKHNSYQTTHFAVVRRAEFNT